jgi:hypothetical protein
VPAGAAIEPLRLGFVGAGALFETVTVPDQLPFFPLADVATRANVCWPLASFVVSSEVAYGAPVAVATATPSTEKVTLRMFPEVVTLADHATVPETVDPEATLEETEIWVPPAAAAVVKSAMIRTSGRTAMRR